MKKVLLLEPLSPWGHKDINEVTIDILHDNYELYYCAAEGYMDNKYSNVKYYTLDKELFTVKSNSLDNRIRLYKAFIKMLQIANDIHPDYVFVMSYDVIVLSFVCMLQSKYSHLYKKMFILNHSNPDEVLSSKIKRFFYKYISDDIKNVFYEDYIGKKISEITDRKYYVLHHNLNDYKKNVSAYTVINDSLSRFFEDKALYLVSVSSNEIPKEIVEEILKLDRDGVLTHNNVKVFIKNKIHDFSSSNVLFYTDFLTDDEYSYIIQQSDYVMILYNDQTYRYRVSGVYFDAITFSKPIFHNENLFIEKQREKYGDIGVMVEKNKLEVAIQNVISTDYSKLQDNICSIREYYSNDCILKEFEEIFK